MQTLPGSLEGMPPSPPISTNIGATIRSYRQQKGMSQGDIEKRTGLLRCYLSRVENGHTVPSLETLQKIAYALDLHLAQFFSDEVVSREMSPLRLSENDRKLLLAMVRKFAQTTLV